MLSGNPVDKVQMPPSSPARNRRLEDGEFERLEEAAKQTKNPHIWPIVIFAIETGMRRGEILGLHWKHVDLDRRIAYLPPTKNGSSREVPLSTKAAHLLVSAGSLTVDGKLAHRGGGIAISGTSKISLAANDNCEVLIIEVPGLQEAR